MINFKRLFLNGICHIGIVFANNSGYEKTKEEARGRKICFATTLDFMLLEGDRGLAQQKQSVRPGAFSILGVY
jgi:hypothetical protein